jgi:hypothetical protein
MFCVWDFEEFIMNEKQIVMTPNEFKIKYPQYSDLEGMPLG